MNYIVEFEPEALADLEKLTQVMQDRIFRKIYWLAENFEQVNPEALTGSLAGFYKLRVGDYRVIYDFSTEEKIITIDKIGL